MKPAENIRGRCFSPLAVNHPNLNHPMKTTKKSPKQHGSQEAASNMYSGLGLGHYHGSQWGIESAPFTGKQPGREARGHLESGEGAPFDSRSGEDTLRVYLNEIGETPLLSREDEAGLGRRIRDGFDALRSHMLGSGYVLEILLERARTEVLRKKCDSERRATLAAHLRQGESLLVHARADFAAGLTQCAARATELLGCFGKLVAALDEWPRVGVDLLDQLESRYAIADLGGASSGRPEAAFSRREFALLNLMDDEACRLFISEARRLVREVMDLRNQMVNANLRLVVSIAKKMTHASLSREDLIQEGNIALMTASERFDERRGNRFSTFAVSLIKASMRRENDNQGRTIRLPVHQCESMRQLEQARVNLEQQLRRMPSAAELANETGFTNDAVSELIFWREGMVSIHGFVGNDNKTRLEDIVPDPNSLRLPYEETELSGRVELILRSLEGSHRAVISCLYGLGGVPQLSLNETAESLRMRTSDVTRLHKEALQAIRAGIEWAGDRFAHAA